MRKPGNLLSARLQTMPKKQRFIINLNSDVVTWPVQVAWCMRIYFAAAWNDKKNARSEIIEKLMCAAHETTTPSPVCLPACLLAVFNRFMNCGFGYCRLRELAHTFHNFTRRHPSSLGWLERPRQAKHKKHEKRERSSSKNQKSYKKIKIIISLD